MDTSMILKELPDGYYQSLTEIIRVLSPGKVYIVKQVAQAVKGGVPAYIKYFFRLPTKEKNYEALITKDFYDNVCRDIHFEDDEIKIQSVAKYLFGKDTITVYLDNGMLIATGPDENKEWQYEFQKYHI